MWDVLPQCQSVDFSEKTVTAGYAGRAPNSRSLEQHMLKELFRFSSIENSGPGIEAEHLEGPSDHARALAKLADQFERSSAVAAIPATAAANAIDKTPPFEQIYQTATIKPPRLAYNILKVSEMLKSPHLEGMSTESRRCSLLMALEAAGAEVEDLLQDAVVRQRALNDFEDAELNRLKELEARKGAENREIQAELDRLTGQYMSLIQANVDAVAREQDNFRAWQKRKQQEVQRITEAATICVPPGTGNGGLTAVLERATALHK